MSCDNLVSAAEAFDEDNYFVAASAGPFNEQTGGRFAAFVLFYLTGDLQRIAASGTFAPAQWLWGNADALTGLGWSLSIAPNPDNLVAPALVASLNNGLVDNTQLLVDLSSSAYIERLILAAVWVTDSGVALSVNGTLVAESVTQVVAASSLPPRVGLGVQDEDPALYAGVVACGYDPDAAGLLVGDRAAGTYAGRHFRSAREGYFGGFLDGAQDIDWLHRYEARSLGQGFVGGLERGTAPAVRSTAPTDNVLNWPDVGNSGYTKSPEAPVQLNRIAV